MYVSKSLSPLPDKLTTTISFGEKVLCSKTARACEVSIAGMIPSNLHRFQPASIACSSVIEINSALLVLHKCACIGPTPG